MKTCCMILLAAFTSLASAQQNDVNCIPFGGIAPDEWKNVTLEDITAMVSRGITPKSVSYTHLDVYKRQQLSLFQ